MNTKHSTSIKQYIHLPTTGVADCTAESESCYGERGLPPPQTIHQHHLLVGSGM